MTTEVPARPYGRTAAATMLAVVALATTSCSSSTPEATPSVKPAGNPSAAASADPETVRMTVAGTERRGSALRLSATLPAGWQLHNGPYAANAGSARSPDGIAFFVSLADNTFEDPCSHLERSPKVGPSVKDLTTALSSLEGIDASEPTEVTLGGQPATYLELTVDGSLPCDGEQFVLWQDSPSNYWRLLGTDETLGIWITKVAGERVLVTSRTYPETPEPRKAELTTILDSIVFDSERVSAQAR